MKSNTPMTTSSPMRKMMRTIQPRTLNMARSSEQCPFLVLLGDALMLKIAAALFDFAYPAGSRRVSGRADPRRYAGRDQPNAAQGDLPQPPSLLQLLRRSADLRPGRRSRQAAAPRRSEFESMPDPKS